MNVSDPSRASIARTISLNVRSHPQGITAAGLYNECGDMFDEPGLSSKQAVDVIQKQLSKLAQQGYVRFDQRNSPNPRMYYPTDKLLAQYAPAQSDENEVRQSYPVFSPLDLIMKEAQSPKPEPENDPFHGLRESLNNSIRLLDRLNPTKKLSNSETIVRDLEKVQLAMEFIHPELADSLYKARAFIISSNSVELP